MLRHIGNPSLTKLGHPGHWPRKVALGAERRALTVIVKIGTSVDVEALMRAGKSISGPIASLRTSDEPFTKPVRFERCSFSGTTDFSHAHFLRGLSFVACTFEQVRFEGARVDGDCGFRAIEFKHEARFDRFRIDGKLDLRAESTNADRKIVQAATSAGEITDRFAVFRGTVSFAQLHVTGEANLGSAQFHRWADFYNAKIDGSLLLRTDRDKRAPAAFPPVRFLGGVRFRAARIGGELNFQGGQFFGTADFSLIDCRGPVFFCDPESDEDATPCCFHRRPAAELLANVAFDPALVPKRKFTSISLSATDGSTRECRTEELNCCADFQSARFGELRLGSTQFESGLDFTDTRYRRISIVKKNGYTDLLAAFERSEVRRFERTRWLQLEAVLRRQGEEASADKIYRKRMWREAHFSNMRLLYAPWAVWWALSWFGTVRWLPAVWCVLIIAGFAQSGEPETHGAMNSFLSFFPQKLGGAGHELTSVPAITEHVIGWILVPAAAASAIGLLNREAAPAEVDRDSE